MLSTDLFLPYLRTTLEITPVLAFFLEAETNTKIVDLVKHTLDETKNCRNEQQRVTFHIALACVMPAREAKGTNNGWITRICDRLGLRRGKRSQKNGGRPYESDQAVDIRAQFNKDVELLQQPLKVGDRVLSNGDLCELTQIGVDLIGPHVGTTCVVMIRGGETTQESRHLKMFGNAKGSARLQRPPRCGEALTKRPFICWCTACSRVRGRGVGCQSSRSSLLVTDCTRTKQSSWTEAQFTVTSSAGIENC